MSIEPTQSPLSLGALEPWHLTPDAFAEHVCGPRFERIQLARFIGEEVAKTVIGGPDIKRRLLLNGPPRQGKSYVFSFATPIWYLEHWPHKKIILATHSDDLSCEYGGKVRDEFRDNNVKRGGMLHTELSPDAKAAGIFNTTQGGGMFCIGVGGKIAGWGAHLLLIDDFYGSKGEAESPIKQKSVQVWLTETILQRLEPGAAVLANAQRWCYSDIGGFMTSSRFPGRHQWKFIKLPALAGDNDPMGRKPGQAISPERFDEAALATIRDGMSKYIWDAQWQQEPTDSGALRAYENFDLTLHVTERVRIDRDIALACAWDFNRTPGMLCEIGQYDRRADEFRVRWESFVARAGTTESAHDVVRRLREIGGYPYSLPPVEIYGDATGTQMRSTSATETDYQIIANIFTEAGIPFRMNVPNRNPPIKERVLSVNDAFKDNKKIPHILVHPDCEHLIMDFDRVPMDPKTGLPDDSDQELTHASSAFGYWVFEVRPVMSLVPKMTSRFASYQGY